MDQARLEYQYQGGGIQDSPLLFLAPTPLGVLELIGVIGLLWYRGRVWWGKPLLLLIAGTYAYWLLGLAAFIVADHHLLLQDTPRLIAPMLAAAGVLTIAHAAPRHRAPALHPHRPEPGWGRSACACSASLSPSPHGRRGCRAAPPRSAGYTSRL